MKVNDFAKIIDSIKCDTQVAERLSAIYGKVLPEAVIKVLSYNKAGEFFDSDDICRLMSTDEVANASKELGVDFIAVGIVPVIDIGDNCFVCFDLASNEWLKYNIIDVIGYCRKSTFGGMFAG